MKQKKPIAMFEVILNICLTPEDLSDAEIDEIFTNLEVTSNVIGLTDTDVTVISYTKKS
jgi:hypothetical protein